MSYAYCLHMHMLHHTHTQLLLQHPLSSYASGCKYVGDRIALDKEGKTVVAHGWGEFFWPKAVKGYEGYWLNGRMHGKGIYFFKDNSGSWEGTFRQDALHGRGLWVSLDRRQKRECYYVNNKKVAWSDELISGVRITVQRNKVGNIWERGTITNFKSKPVRHFIKWDMKDGTWVDLAIETWAVLDNEPNIKLLLETTDL
jgi:hypothetical protein